MDNHWNTRMNRTWRLAFVLHALAATLAVQAQDDLLKELDAMQPASNEFTYATFKGTRLVDLHTIETLGARSLEFRIAHRFGTLGSGAQNLWGLDGPASIQFRLDYALTDRLMVGVGRTSDRKVFDGFIKYKWLRQTTDNSMPVTMTVLGTANILGERDPGTPSGNPRYGYFANRMSYIAMVMVARKFNARFSAQASPIYVHHNLVDQLTDKNDVVAVAGSMRYKFTRSVALTAEYIAPVTLYSRDMSQFFNVLALGFDIETGGHVFQLFVTNGYSINESQVIPYTTGSWRNKEMRLGFNVSRTFEFSGRKKPK
jgi:hypothetical protein